MGLPAHIAVSASAEAAKPLVFDMRLADMKRGDTAKVVCVEGEGQLRKRLLDLGFTSGAEVRMIRIAPLGDPVEVELRGYRLTVRKTEAAIVVLEASEGCCACSEPEPQACAAAEEAPAEEAPVEAAPAEEPAPEAAPEQEKAKEGAE